MKSKLNLSFAFIILTVLFSSNAFSQVPHGFNYQAVARDADGKEIASSALQVMISILSDTSGFRSDGKGNYIWEEQHEVNTNLLGLFSLVAGNPDAIKIQGSAASFSEIDWKQQPLFIGTKIYYQGDWKIMGSSRLWTVPYSMVSSELAGPVKKLEVTGATTNLDEALFEVKNKNGQTVFAVYSEGVRIYVDDGLAKGSKGGFAIGGFGDAKAGSQEYFIVSPDSIRAYIGTNPAKGSKGGFAIGGFDRAKAPGEEYLRVTRDSTRVYVNQDASKGSKGGFAIGGFDPAKGPVTGYMNITPNNYFIGQMAGKSITSGLYNSFMGFEAGLSATTGGNNSFMGYKSGRANTSGTNNTFLGNQAGFSNIDGSANTFVGSLTGYGLTTGSNNTYLGVGAGVTFQNGNYNVFIGNLAGAGYQFPANTTGGSNNVAVGTGAGYRLNTGSSNVFLGNFAGAFTTSASDNVFLGYQSGYGNSTGPNNIFIGYQSGSGNTTGSNNVFMGKLSGASNGTGYDNTYIGNESGYLSNGSRFTVALGTQTGYNNTGISNVFIGHQAGYGNTSGMQNIFMGTQAGVTNTEGYNNVFLGVVAGQFNTLGAANVFIGTSTGYKNTTGMYNTSVGNLAGANNQTGSSNVFIGNMAGMNETGSNKLYIENSSADKSSALIYGEFDNNLLAVNGNLGIGTSLPSTRLDVAGGNWNVTGSSEGDMRVGNSFYRLKIGVATAGGGAGDVRLTAMGGTNRLIFGGNGVDLLAITNANIYPWTDNTVPLGLPGNRFTVLYAVNGTINTSDARMKENIREINHGLESLLKLEPVMFSWKGENPGKTHLGLLAQDVESVIPEIVDRGDDPLQTLGISYTELMPVMIKSIKQQQEQIESLKKENTELSSELRSLKELVLNILKDL